ncbi:hypothetical protein BSLG_006979 [Batrachochytrium salamandrivorans]|nr:hypothetical protein BSLG_006979 [Batrachochytrium salamandrivorans]
MTNVNSHSNHPEAAICTTTPAGFAHHQLQQQQQQQQLDPTLSNVAAWRSNKQVPFDLDTTYFARDSRSKDKCKRFFGEQRIPILAGSGSAAKLRAFFGANTGGLPFISSPSLDCDGSTDMMSTLPKGATTMHHSSSISLPISPANTPPAKAPLQTHLLSASKSKVSPSLLQTNRPELLTLDTQLPSPSEPLLAHRVSRDCANLVRRKDTAGNRLSPKTHHRCGSYDSVSSRHSASPVWAKEQLADEIKRCDPPLNAVQTAKIGSLIKSFKHIPRLMSVDSLLDCAQHQAPVSADSSRATLLPLKIPSDTCSPCHSPGMKNSPGIVLSDGKLRELDVKLGYLGQSPQAIRSLRRTQKSNDTLVSLTDSLSSQAEANIVAHTPLMGASVRKITAIFGEAGPVDTSVHQIERDGLWSILISNLPLCYFLFSLLKEHTPELLFFILDANHFAQTTFTSDEELQRAAQALFTLYFITDAPFELNVSQKVKCIVSEGIKTMSSSCFNKAVQEVIVLLDNAYNRFKTGSHFQTMKRDLGKHTVLHQEATVRKVETLLYDAVPADSTLLGRYRRLQLQAIRDRTKVFIKDKLVSYVH